MSVVRAIDLSPHELRSLGNNLSSPRFRRRRPRRTLWAVNRSLKRLAENVPQLHRMRVCA